ncbi:MULTISPECIES: tol-pal system YbgF family protein [unclassified Parafrankia]|uniref:tetratricopeptide repeat protein n=1 Tax=unclassified Parafrankia TaxID=2994368 RepID=UPI000DA5AFFF|nr:MULTISPECIES: hypothetical protein [unclassified Parafrankia]TCJ40580.1 hypothetical protein E0504_04480 [Parafrankia sp. BMG5.11]SQD97516.1 conserved membrane hypothetical protein [Parafrankia sp. Ea1.12]
MTQGEPTPKPAARSHDPLAVAVANASLFGGGYLMLGRGQLAVVVLLITVELLIIFASVAQTLWFGLVVLAWWVAVIVHGWYLAGGRPHRGRIRPFRSRRQWVIAVACVLPVLLAFGLLRFDVARIEGDVAQARRAGDCPRVESAVGRVSPAHRMVDVSPGADGEGMAEACGLLRTAVGPLDAGLAGDTKALDQGFQQLTTVLTELPGNEGLVEAALDRFLDGLPTEDPCITVRIATWLAERPSDGGELDRARRAVPRIAPAALADCGSRLLAAADWEHARASYQQLLDEYPDHELAPAAREGVRQAAQKIEEARIAHERAVELANLRNLLRPSGSAQPRYCAAPVPFSAAPAGPNRALTVGDTQYTSKLPAEWKTDDVATATRVLCVGASELGAAVETCRYTSGNVTFHRVAIPVRVYELRTGQLLADTRVEIGGTSCPYLVYGYSPTRSVTPSDSQVQAAFRPLISP